MAGDLGGGGKGREQIDLSIILILSPLYEMYTLWLCIMEHPWKGVGGKGMREVYTILSPLYESYILCWDTQDLGGGKRGKKAEINMQLWYTELPLYLHN